MYNIYCKSELQRDYLLTQLVNHKCLVVIAIGVRDTIFDLHDHLVLLPRSSKTRTRHIINNFEYRRYQYEALGLIGRGQS